MVKKVVLNVGAAAKIAAMDKDQYALLFGKGTVDGETATVSDVIVPSEQEVSLCSATMAAENLAKTMAGNPNPDIIMAGFFHGPMGTHLSTTEALTTKTVGMSMAGVFNAKGEQKFYSCGKDGDVSNIGG